jgi:hypothetical protein
MNMQVSVDAQLKQVDGELGAIFERVDAAQRMHSAAAGGDGSLDQIAFILKKQMDTLVWVDQETGEGDGILRERFAEIRTDLGTSSGKGSRASVNRYCSNEFLVSLNHDSLDEL